MSKIQKTLADATEINPSKRANETITSQAYMARLALGVQQLNDAEWAKLSPEVQDWFNDAADAIEAKRDIPAFPDLPKEEVAPAAGRRRGAAKEEAPAVYEPKVGDMVIAVTKRGKSHAGKIVELDEQGIVLEVGDNDVELDHDKLTSITLDGVADAGSNSAPDEAPAEPEVSDTVEVVTKRGKTIFGNVSEISETELVITDASGEIHEFDIDKLTSVKVKVKNAGAAGKSQPPAATETAGRRGAAKSAPAAAEKPARQTAAANGGVSITTRIREIMVDNLDANKEQIASILKKEGLEFKDATLGLTYGDTKKVIDLLRDRKLID